MSYFNQIWKPIPNYENYYLISNTGQIKSITTNKILSDFTTNNYHQVTLTKDTERKTFKVHRLVAQAFIPNPNNLPQVNHKDENTNNNFVYNLEWCDAKYNSNFGTRTKRIADKNRGTTNGTTSKPIQQYSLSGVFLNEYPSGKEIERQLGFTTSSISSCCRGITKTSHGFIWKFT